MATIRKDIVCRSDQINVRSIDRSVKNPWRWEWIEKQVEGVYVKDVIRKIDKSGIAYCVICCKELLYGNRGFAAIADHIKSMKHVSTVEARKQNFALPGSSQSASAKERSSSLYGLHPMFSSANISAETCIPKPSTPLVDRIANSEAMLLSFLAEKSLPFSLAADLLELIKRMSEDRKALNRLTMHRTSASYKLRFGVAKTIGENVIQDLRKEKFSLNIDESTSNNNAKVVTVLVNYLRNDKIVTEHLQSFSLDSVNSTSLFEGIERLMESNAIPWHNLMSVLLDSCNVMRGKKAGLEVKLREKCPHLLDIDGDSCHHAHNAAKKFCKPFNLHLESLCSDIHNDFKWSPDLRSALREICDILNVKYTVPQNYISFRWLSIYDVAQDFSRLFTALILFYFSFLKHSEKTDFLHMVVKIYKDLNVNKAGRDGIRKLQTRLAVKQLTAAGNERKSRITRKLFVMNLKTKLIMNFYVSVLPLLKEYVKLFQSNSCLIHKLHDKQVELLKNFMSCFMKPEVLKCIDKPTNKTKNLDVGEKNNHLPMKYIFVGDKVTEIIAFVHKSSEDVKLFQKVVVEAYVSCSQSLVSKMPVENPFLRSASAIDPICRQHYMSLKLLKELPLLVKNVLPQQEKDLFAFEVQKYHSDAALSFPDEKEPIVKWWVERKKSYPLLSKIAFALLTCFHGPKVEASFSMMNNVITPGSSRLNIRTFNAIQTVKYHLLAEGKSSVEYFKKSDFLQESVESKLVKNLRSACKSYEEEKSQQRKTKLQKLKNLRELREKTLSKEKAKKICANAAKKQRLKHLKKVNRITVSEGKEKRISTPKAPLPPLKVKANEEIAVLIKDNSKKPKRTVSEVSVAERPQPKKRKTTSFNIKEMFERAASKKTGN